MGIPVLAVRSNFSRHKILQNGKKTLIKWISVYPKRNCVILFEIITGFEAVSLTKNYTTSSLLSLSSLVQWQFCSVLKFSASSARLLQRERGSWICMSYRGGRKIALPGSKYTRFHAFLKLQRCTTSACLFAMKWQVSLVAWSFRTSKHNEELQCFGIEQVALTFTEPEPALYYFVLQQVLRQCACVWFFSFSFVCLLLYLFMCWFVLSCWYVRCRVFSFFFFSVCLGGGGGGGGDQCECVCVGGGGGLYSMRST